jgi:site-specific DNA recombinase
VAVRNRDRHVRKHANGPSPVNSVQASKAGSRHCNGRRHARRRAPMIAAIYARKSTDQKGIADESKSVPQQIANARAYAAKMGWLVNDAHVYQDDKISGAEFEKRPGFMRMMTALKPKAPFQVLIVRDGARRGRESSQTAYAIKQLAEAGVEIFDYLLGQSLTPKNAIDKIMSNVQGFADENHRERSSQLVHEAHTRKHKAGHVVGGRCFGYRNEHVGGLDAHGNFLKSHTRRVIDPIEAAVVRRIFELYDGGEGLKRIAKLLTSEGAAHPKPFHDPNGGLRPCTGWSPSTVRTVLNRETYRGVVIWNKTRKKNDWGKHAPTDRPESEWIRTSAPDLRIIDEPLWKRVASRRQDVEGKAVRFASGRISGRPPKHATTSLLAGLATCGLCGGGLIIEHSNNRKGKYCYYICHRRRTSSTCTNRLRIPIEDMNEAVLQAVEEHALTPEAIEQVIHLTERDDAQEQQAALAREQKDVTKRIGRLIAAIEAGGDAASLVAKLRELETRKRAIDGEVAALRPVPRLAPAVIEGRLAEWRRLLRASTTQGRTVLQRILRGRLTFTPRLNPVSGEPDGYDFEGPTRFDKLFSGIAVERPTSLASSDIASEHYGADETFDGDYGRLLEAAAMRKGWRARQELNLRPSA